MSFGDIDSKVDSEELIFGLLARKFIREAYETSKMGISIEKLENLVIKIHKGAVDWHQRIIRR